MAASMSRTFFKFNSNISNLFRVSAAQNISFTFAKRFHLSRKLNDSFNIQDNDDFRERVLNSPVPVIVDFHATWCGPCKLLGPRLESIISNYKEKVHLAKVDVDQNEDIAFEYDVSAVPVVLAVKSGKEVNKFIGLKDEDEIKSFVDKLVGS